MPLLRVEIHIWSKFIGSVVNAFKLATVIQTHIYIEIFSYNDFFEYSTPKRISPPKLKLSIV